LTKSPTSAKLPLLHTASLSLVLPTSFAPKGGKMNPTRVSRRGFLRLSASAAVGSLLVACAAPIAPASTKAGAGEVAASGAELEIWTYPRTENDADIVYKPLMAQFAEMHP